jgi:hypothetical protein
VLVATNLLVPAVVEEIGVEEMVDETVSMVFAVKYVPK